jgi:ribonucleoside-diphosphate reductase alpha chain
MRLMDDVVTLEIEYIDRILDKLKNDPEPEEVKRTEIELWKKVKNATQSSRRTGLGYTGLGDALAALGLKYDSDKAIRMIKTIMKVKFRSEWDCSIDLGTLRGNFKGHNIAKEFTIEGDSIKGNNPFYQMMVDEFSDIVERMIHNGRRNLSLSCLAPTGTTSMMTQTTSGIEPVFQPAYKRRRKVNPNEKGVNIAFVDDNGDAWEEFNVVHHKFKDWYIVASQMEHVPHMALEALERASEEDMEKLIAASPYAGATANDIDWIKRVEIQGVIQKYTTHSISSTINLPEDVTTEEVGQIYMEAWKKGLKGITVYRDGSRSGVLVTNKKEDEKVNTFNDHHAPRRPKRLEAKLVRFNNNKERWIAFVGLMDNKPYEIFTGRLEDIKIPLKIESGQVVKVKDEEGNKRYDFEYEEGTLEGIDRIFNDDFWNYAKLVSSTLRHGMPLHFVVDMVSNLSLAEDHINTWKNGVARTLKKFIPDGKAEGMKCRDCGSDNVIFEEGCSRCRDCGSSKCG